MGRRTGHAPGTFSWVDLGTTDLAAASSFHGDLFGWEMDRNDVGDGMTYTVARLGGDSICGLHAITEEMLETGVPASWLSHVTVAGADAAVARAVELGGAAVDAAFDVLDAGRMAVLSDPQGAVFAAWEPRRRIGAERVNDTGCLCMNELATTDLDGALAFYSGLFGWTTGSVEADTADSAVVSVYNDGTLNASVSRAEDGERPHWRPYFTVDSLEASLDRIAALGGETILEPLDIDDGRIAIAGDPQGAVFALFEGEVDP